MKTALLVIILAVSAGVLFAIIRADQGQSFNSSNPRPVYKEPAIGMDIAEFFALCGEAKFAEKDKIVSNITTASGTLFTLKYDDSSKRPAENCSGAFSFTNGYMTLISR